VPREGHVGGKMLVDGRRIQMPPASATNVTLPPVKPAKKAKRKSAQKSYLDQ
jgi:hypothetical protein